MLKVKIFNKTYKSYLLGS